MATSDLYAGITLLLPDPGKVFPGEFDPHRPWDTMILDCVSQEEFSDAVYKANGIAAVPLEFFLEDPELERGVRTPDSVELRDGGTYVMIPRKQDIPDKPVEEMEQWEIDELVGEMNAVKAAVKQLEDNGDISVPIVFRQVFTAADGSSRRLSGAIGDKTAAIVKYQTVMDSMGAAELADLVKFVNDNKDKKHVSEANDPNDPADFPAATPTDAMDGNGNGNGSNAPSAVPRRLGQARLPNRMRSPAMLTRPRLANKGAAGFRVSF